MPIATSLLSHSAECQSQKAGTEESDSKRLTPWLLLLVKGLEAKVIKAKVKEMKAQAAYSLLCAAFKKNYKYFITFSGAQEGMEKGKLHEWLSIIYAHKLCRSEGHEY